jgi:hypothetical protein
MGGDNESASVRSAKIHTSDEDEGNQEGEGGSGENRDHLLSHGVGVLQERSRRTMSFSFVQRGASRV